VFGIIPESEADVSTVVSGYATTVDDDAKDDEPNNGNDLDDAEDEFNCLRLFRQLSRLSLSPPFWISVSGGRAGATYPLHSL
jgi:hypothetical protein